MLEALLFGYERGAFTGAHAAHPGKFEQAQGGTLLLDEISEMPLGLQAKLLRVLQEREVERLGGRGFLALDVRVLATTNRLLRDEVSAGRFREDLYYRLNVFPVVITPLRERRDDILPIAMQLLSLRTRPGERIPALSADAAHCLLVHPWPGNVRELDNVLQRAIIMCQGPVIEAEHIETESVAAPRAVTSVGSLDAARARTGALARSLERAEQEILLEALRSPQITRRAIAAHLGISPRTLRYKLARLRAAGVDVPAA
jgi:two-component system response regulator FlrC